ncbi:hypothetical protein BDZ97DRAFT_1925054 [Flammula alnicola]|nr:hypothetical protein BDZ97DRAFT_1925054 [Flammula alnicola]
MEYIPQTQNAMLSLSNAVISGGTFTQHNGPSIVNINGATGGFELLRKEVATAAFHNSAQRLDPPKCHPNTREAVLQKIMAWIQTSEDRETWLMWLHGAAGAGKSAIAQSIAEICAKSKLAIASFFFFRTDPTRNSVRPLAATLAYQLALSLPVARDIIGQAVERDPLVFGLSFASQLESLIVEPLRQIGRLPHCSTSITSPFLIIIDGLDECDGRDVQTNIVHAISEALRDADLPILFLVASRPEQHLSMAFNLRKVTDILTRLALDDKYLPDEDIRLFLNDKFAEIKISHPFMHLIDSSWPAEDILYSLIEKSSGQFIYASVVMKFVSSPRHHPAQRLEVIQGIRPPRLDTPFAQLDALYVHIFSCVEDIQTASLVLSYSILGSTNQVDHIDEFLSLAKGDVEIALADLASVVATDSSRLKFLHASLPDFLLDPARSQEYYIDPPRRHADFAHRWFEHLKAGNYKVTHILAITWHLQAAAPTNELQLDLMRFVPRAEYFSGDSEGINEMSEFLSSVKALVRIRFID